MRGDDEEGTRRAELAPLLFCFWFFVEGNNNGNLNCFHALRARVTFLCLCKEK
jgi:hypothetical protein